MTLLAVEMEAIGERLSEVCAWYHRIAKLQRKWGPIQQVILYPCRFCHRFAVDEWYPAQQKSNHKDQGVAEVESVDEARDLYRGILRLRESHYIRETENYTADRSSCNFVVSHMYCICKHCRRPQHA